MIQYLIFDDKKEEDITIIFQPIYFFLRLNIIKIMYRFFDNGLAGAHLLVCQANRKKLKFLAKTFSLRQLR